MTKTTIKTIVTFFIGVLAVFWVYSVIELVNQEEENTITECQNMKGTPQFERKEEWREGEKTIYHYEYIGCYLKK